MSDQPEHKTTAAGSAAVRNAVNNAEVVEFPSERFGGGPWDPLDLDMTYKAHNDLGNSERLRARFGDDLRYVRDVGWHVWSGTHWEQEGGEEAVKMRAQQTAVAIRREVSALAGNARSDMSAKELEGMLDKFAKWAAQSGNSNRLAAMVTEARPHLTVSWDNMDADKYRVNVLNGTFDVRGGSFDIRPHDREDFITNAMNVEYDANATCPQFDAFLARVQPDPQVREFLQRWFGYSLTGLTHEQVLVFFWGEGANGKSVLVDVFARMFGGFGVSLPFQSLLRDENKRGSEANPDLARLPGARMVRASEPEKGAVFSEATIKTMTGCEEMTVRHLRKDFFDFLPQFKVTISGNHRPRVMGQDHGIWRRILLVTWGVIIPEEDKDKGLTDKLWAERAGIFNWMLDGLRMYLEDGLRIPKAIMDATARYRVDSDPLGLFISACLERAPGEVVQGKDMYEAYLSFCRANAEQPWKQRTFGDNMPERGWNKEKVGGYVYYQNVRLVNVPTVHHGGTEGDPPDGYEE